MLRKALVAALVLQSGACTALRTTNPDLGPWPKPVGWSASIELAESLLASDDDDERARGYAIRSLLYVDAGDRVMGMSEAMLTSAWWPLLPVGLVYDVVVMPAQWWHHWDVSDRHRLQASRDIDEARRLGVAADEHGHVQLFGRTFKPIDETGFYVSVDAGR